MTLPNETKLGDLRITDGIIAEIGDVGPWRIKKMKHT